MVVRKILAFSSEGLRVSADSPHLTEGTPINNFGSTPDGTIFTYFAGENFNLTIEDTFDPDNLNDSRPDDHVVIKDSILPIGTGIEAESRIDIQQLDSNGNPTGPVISIHVYSKDGDSSDIWGFSTSGELIPGEQYVKVGGTGAGGVPYEDIVGPLCFAAGTMIRTENGYEPVETLEKGMKVWTQSGGFQKIRWIGASTASGHGKFAPIRFEAGVLNNLRPLIVSANHRILYKSAEMALAFDDEPVLIAAKHFVGLDGVSFAFCDQITYYHFMFDAHQIVDAEGSLSESFYPGPVAIDSLEHSVKQELFALFPELASQTAAKTPPAARVLREYEARVALSTAA